eukprot:8260961-Karenia_brevis.AAC.1
MHHSFQGEPLAPGSWDFTSHGIYDCLRQYGVFNPQDLTSTAKGRSSMSHAYDDDVVEPDDPASP